MENKEEILMELTKEMAEELSNGKGDEDNE